MKNYQSSRFEVEGSFPPLKPEGQKVIGCREAQIIQLFDELSLSVAVGNISWKKRLLVGGFNPSEHYLSKRASSPNRGENNKFLKPPARQSRMMRIRWWFLEFSTCLNIKVFPLQRWGRCPKIWQVLSTPSWLICSFNKENVHLLICSSLPAIVLSKQRTEGFEGVGFQIRMDDAMIFPGRFLNYPLVN